MKYLITKILPTVAVFTIFGSLAGIANATIINVDASNSGWYNPGGTFNGTNNNIYQNISSYRDWLGFNLSSVSGTIVGATLEVASNINNSPNQNVSWWDVTTTYSSLGTVNSAAIYTDLGSGAQFASGIQTNGTINNFTLNAAALASLNAATSFWAIGGRNDSTGDSFGYTSGVGSGDFIRLVLDVQADSVPDGGATVALLGLGFGLVAFVKRKMAA